MERGYNREMIKRQILRHKRIPEKTSLKKKRSTNFQAETNV